jgi:predicted choloylglycine hydrolase
LDLDFETDASKRYLSISDKAVASCNALLSAVDVRKLGDRFIDSIIYLVRKATADRFQQEAESLAERHRTDWQSILLANVSYDVMLSTIGCSTIALPTPNGPVVARNMDWPPQGLLAKASHLLKCRKSNGSFVHAAWPASIGAVTGLSERGFAIVVNAAENPEDESLAGYPVLLFVRSVLEDASDFQDAVRRLSSEKLAMSAMITVVGTDNKERVVIERSPSICARRWPGDGKPLIVTNHHRALLPAQPCQRYERLEEMLATRSEADVPEEDALLTMLTDKGVMQEITAQHVTIRPKDNLMRLYVPTALLNHNG